MTVIRSTMVEELADHVHIMWSGWMNHLFKLCKAPTDDTAIIPAELVARWLRQCNTEYSELPYHEKGSDREEAIRILELLHITQSEAPATSDYATMVERLSIVERLNEVSSKLLSTDAHDSRHRILMSKELNAIAKELLELC